MSNFEYGRLLTPHRRQCGFSRPEIFVVLAIVLGFAFFLLQFFGGNAAREKARGAVCASNLKSLAAAFAQYAADNNNCYPSYTTYPLVSTKGKWYIKDKFGRALRPYPAHPDLLVASLKPYTHTDAVWFCPSDPLAHNNNLAACHVISQVLSDHRYSSYVTPMTFANYPTTPDGFEVMDQAGKHYRMGGEDSPSKRALISEEYIMVSPPHSFFRDLVSNSSKSPALYSHRGRLNSVAVDGHLISTDLPRN